MFSFSVIFSFCVLIYLTFSSILYLCSLLCLHHYLVFVFSICVLILVRLGELIEKTYLIDDSYHVSLVLHDFLSLKNIININYL
ncbi:hypothetical protein D6X60_20475 [Escherichia albertii]|nr:hypothetical protein [Escherichia albertii]EEW7342788.1 hypothetical protein [Escherichia albertii]